MLLSSEQLARKVIGLSLRTTELTNAMQLSKEHMDKIRNDNQKAIRMERQMAQARLKEQKNHYETIVTRHQEFIEQVSNTLRCLNLSFYWELFVDSPHFQVAQRQSVAVWKGIGDDKALGKPIDCRRT